MKHCFKLSAAAFSFAVLLLGACSSPRQMRSDISDTDVNCTPEVLESVADTIRATVTVGFPSGYFKPSAMMVATPVVVYADGQRTGEAQIWQGENIKANYKVIPYSGGSVSFDVEYEFVPGMEQCTLELRCQLLLDGGRTIDMAPVKVADGCIATYRLADTRGEYSLKPDGFVQVTTHTTSTSILFDVNSSRVKNDVHNRNALKVYKSYLEDLEKDPRYQVTGAQIVAYASPEGGVKLNEDLSKDRADAAISTWNSVSDGVSDSVKVSSVGQDWEGFKEAMENSDIEDKDLILRILSMYSDPAVRESEIRNLSFIYEDIKKEVFPELRRASLVVNAEHLGYSDEELAQMAVKQLSLLSEPEILHLAAVTDSIEAKKYYYRVTTEKWGSNAGFYALATIALDEDKIDVALAYLTHTDEADPDVLNLLGAIEMRRGNLDSALGFFEMADTPDAHKNIGTILILKGKYDEAAKLLAGSGSRNEALAHILAGDCDKALSILSGNTPRECYLAAVASVRKGDATAAEKYLDAVSAFKNDSARTYIERAAKDAEFAGLE